MFKLDNNASSSGTSLQAYIEAPYARLEQLFGKPTESDFDKVSGKWIFTDTGTGESVVTLYDYKSTELYNSNYPTVEEFRALPSYEWHVGAKNAETADRFVRWLTEQLSSEPKESNTNPATEQVKVSKVEQILIDAVRKANENSGFYQVHEASALNAAFTALVEEGKLIYVPSGPCRGYGYLVNEPTDFGKRVQVAVSNWADAETKRLQAVQEDLNKVNSALAALRTLNPK